MAFRSSQDRKRANYHSDRVYFWAWAAVALGMVEETYPVPPEVLLQFVRDHLHGLDPLVDQTLVDFGTKKWLGPQRAGTIQRRLYALRHAHQERGLDSSCLAPEIRQLLADAQQRPAKPRRRMSNLCSPHRRPD